MSIYGKYQPALNQILAELTHRLEEMNQNYQAQHGQSLFEHLNGRVKSDSIGLRIVCNFIDDIYTCIAPIQQMPDLKIVQKKDYITNAKKNGYRSYHLILLKKTQLEDVDGQKSGKFYVEIQLRTIAMDTWASWEHEMKYKHQIKNAALISQELKRVADELASCDVSMQTIRHLIREEN